jgi:hypothetical protein
MEKQVTLSPSIQESNALLPDGYDSCIIGFCPKSERLVYSREKMIDLLVKRDGMSDTTAIEFLEFNTWRAYAGEHTPIYVWTDIIMDEDDGMWTEEEMKDFRNQFPEPEIIEYEDTFKTAEFKSLPRWRRFVVRLRVALAATFEMF